MSAPRKHPAEHVVFRFEDGAFHCLHCGDAYEMRLPCNVSVLVAASSAYRKQHRYCRKLKLAASGKEGGFE